MGQPPAYNRVKDFTEDFGSETDHSALNAELDSAANSINDIRTNIAILQADDGKLRPDVVTTDSVTQELFNDLVDAAAQGAATAASTATTQANIATEQAALATTNGAAQVALATAQANAAAASATEAGSDSALASDWAQKTGAYVTGLLASAKEWAVGTLLRGLAGGGSAKDWATYTGGKVDDTEYSAKKYAVDASTSANAAAVTAASFNDANILHRTGDETSSGVKTFSGGIITPSLNSGPLAGLRNRIINGDIRIDQAHSGAAVALNATTLTYLVDMWGAGWVGGAAVATAQQLNNQLPMSPFTLKFTITTASVPSGNQAYNLQQRIEGLNVADLQFGLSGAKQITLSFKVRSSLTGQFSGAIQNGAQNRAYPFTFNIAAANTEQDVSVTIPGDVAGTWATDITTGMIVAFDLGGAGTSRSAASGWQAGVVFGVTGSVNLVATLGATFEITEVQLEAGSVATPFERRTALEPTLCQRYFKYIPSFQWKGYAAAGDTAYVPIYIGPMRSQPSVIVGSWTLSNVASSNQVAISSQFGEGYVQCLTSVAGSFIASANNVSISARL